jgi:hypothetical protein
MSDWPHDSVFGSQLDRKRDRTEAKEGWIRRGQAKRKSQGFDSENRQTRSCYPDAREKNVPKGTLHRIIELAGLTPEEFNEL